MFHKHELIWESEIMNLFAICITCAQTKNMPLLNKVSTSYFIDFSKNNGISKLESIIKLINSSRDN